MESLYTAVVGTPKETMDDINEMVVLEGLKKQVEKENPDWAAELPDMGDMVNDNLNER